MLSKSSCMNNISEVFKSILESCAVPSLIVSKEDIPVFMFHQVLESIATDENLDRSICLEKDTFKNVLLLIMNNFKVICLKKLLEEKHHSKERCCIITFDDGWLDNYQVAFPILKQYSLPATIFVSTSLVGTNDKFWFTRLANIINSENVGKREKYSVMLKFLPRIDERIDIDTTTENIYSQFCIVLKKLHPSIIDSYINTIENNIFTSCSQQYTRNIINWDEVAEMSNNNISFGSHGVTHSIFTRLSTSEKAFEIYKSKSDLLSKNINYVNCLSFPNGNYDQETLDISTQAGYNLFFSASINKCGEGKSGLLAHRINISHNSTDTANFNYSLLKAKITGRLFRPKLISI